MDILTRRFRGVIQEFRIYSQAEADAKGVEYVPWRKCEKGEWVLSDDGFVGECLDIMGPYHSKIRGTSRRYFVFSFGKKWEQKYGNLNYLDRKTNKSFSSTSDAHWTIRETKSYRGKMFIDAYVAMFLTGRIDWARLGHIYRPDHKNPTRAAKFIIKQEVFKKMIEERLKKEFSDRGINQGDVIDRYLDIYERANTDEHPNLKLMKQVNDEFRDMLDMLPKQIPRGRGLLPGEEIDAEFAELEATADKAEIESGQKKLEAGETEEE